MKKLFVAAALLCLIFTGDSLDFRDPSRVEASLGDASGALSPRPLNAQFTSGSLAHWSILGGSPTWTGSANMPATTPSLGDSSNGRCKGMGRAAHSGPAISMTGGGTRTVRSDRFTVPGDARRATFAFFALSGNNPTFNISIYPESDTFQQRLLISGSLQPGQAVYTSCDIAEWAGDEAEIQLQSSQGTLLYLSGGSFDGVGEALYPDLSSDPVSFVSGALTHSHTDIAVPGRGIPLEFTRNYASTGTSTAGDLGWGWTHSYSSKLTVGSSGDVEVQYPGGGSVYFINTSGTLTPPRGIYDALVKNVDNTYTLTTKSQVRFNYDANGQFASIKDRNNNTTTLAYNGSGQLTSVSDPSGRQLVFTPDSNGRIGQITDPLGRTVTFGYGANGDLTSVTDVKGGVTEFTYSNHLLLTIEDALGHVQVINEYDSAGRVVEQRDALSNKTCFYYGANPDAGTSDCPAIVAPPDPGETIMVDARGNREIHQFDKSFRPTGIENALGQTTLYAYEDSTSCSTPIADNGNLCAVTNGLGHATTFTYDARGNVKSAKDALNNTWNYQYTTLNDIDTVTDPRSNVTDYNYTSGNLTSIVDAFSKTTTLAYADAGNPGLVTSITDPLSHTTAFTYDSRGNLTSVADALANTVSHTYDLGGRVLTTTDAMTPARTTTFTYDNQNNVLTIQDPVNGAGAKTEYTYDAVGNRKTFKNTRGYTTAYDYDDKNRLTKVTDPLNRATQYTYDGNDNLLTLKDQRRQASANVVTYTYDTANRLTKIAYPDVHYVTDYTYDAAGRRLTMTDTRGSCSTTGSGCPVGATQQDTTTYGYDIADRLTSVQTTYGATRTVQYGYDGANNRTSISYPDGKVASYTYDARNRMKTVSASWIPSSTTTYNYDDAGRLTSTVLPASTGITTSYGYDIADRLTSMSHVKAGAPPTTLSFANYVLNPNGNRTQITDTTGVTTYTYDNLDRLTGVTYPGPTTTAYAYDGVGNRASMQVDANPATAYAYDAADQITSVGGAGTTHDLNGNLRVIGALPATPDKFLLDHENRLFRTGLCRGDLNGDFVVNVTDLNVVASRFNAAEGSAAYDQLADVNHDRVINVLDSSQVAAENGYACGSSGANTGTGRYVYNGDGLRLRATTKATGQAPVDNDSVWTQGDGLPVVLQDVRMQSGTSTTTTFLYGLDLISATDNAGVTSYYLTDGLGSTRALTDSAGAVTDTYSYDAYGAVRAQTGVTNNDFRFTGEQADDNANRGLYYLRARHYDPALGRFLTKDPLPLPNRYAYVLGNPTNLVDPFGFDAEPPVPVPPPTPDPRYVPCGKLGNPCPILTVRNSNWAARLLRQVNGVVLSCLPLPRPSGNPLPRIPCPFNQVPRALSLEVIEAPGLECGVPVNTNTTPTPQRCNRQYQYP